MADNTEAFNNLKKEIRSILIPQKEGCSLFQFRKDFKCLLGRDVPYNNFNYQSELQLLKSIPDTVRISQSGGDYHLMAVADESTRHIQKMVAKQKPPKHKPSKNRYAPRLPSRTASKPGSFMNNYVPYAGKQASYPSYATPVVSKTSAASQFTRSMPSYTNHSAQFDNNLYARQPVPGASVPSYDNRPALVANKPVPIANQSVSNKPVPIARQSVSNESSFYSSNPVSGKSQTASLVKKSTASNTSTSSWVGQSWSDVPPRFRAPVTNILPPEVECRIVSVVRLYTTGLRMSDFPKAYQGNFKEIFSWDKYGFASLKQCLDSIPDLELTLLPKDYMICYVGKNPTKPNSAQKTAGKQLPVDFNFPSKPSSTSEKDKASQVFKFSAGRASPSASYEHQSQKQHSFNQESDKQLFTLSTESHNLKSDSPLDEKSKYYQDSEVLKKLSSNEGIPKRKADVLDTFELSSTLGVTDKIKKNMIEIMSKNKHGIYATEFPTIYEKVTGSSFNLHSLGFNDLTELVDALPDIFRRKRVEGSRKDWIIVPPGEEVNESSSTNIHALVKCSIQNIRNILEGFPEGIRLSEFLNVYSTNLNEPLYILDLGFNCIDDFLLSISEEVPLRIETVDGFKTVFLTETKEVEPPIEEIPATRISSLPVYEVQESIPFDAASPDCQYRLQQLPPNFDRSVFVPAYTSAILHPGHLYVQLEGEETTEALNKLYDDIGEFYYGPYSYQYQLKRTHLKKYAMCAALWPQKTRGGTTGDNLWYRAMIIGHKHDSAMVFYVDYGTRDEVPLTMLRYLKVAYTKLPAQAIKARLAHIKPPNNAPRFSPGTQKRLLELCMDIRLMAKVEDEKDGVLSLLLCDTSGEEDLYINDILLQEGFAVSISEQNSPPQQPIQYSPQQVFQAQCYWQMFNSLSSAMQQVSLDYSDNPLLQQTSMQLFQNIPSNPTILPPSASNSPSSEESEIFEDDDDLFEEFYQKASSVSKRYVKRVRTSDGYFFHVLIVDGKAFVSSGDVSMLIWNDKSPQYLLERLQTRDIIFPSHCISEFGNETMFHQFEKFHVKGTQNNAGSSSIIIYPLESVIPLLNLYGHPSVELRHKIMMEIESFNPQLPAWQEVSEVEMPETEEEVFQAVTDDDKLKRLCIHDLMAMKEGIRQKRNTMVRNLESDTHDGSTVDELDKLEGLLQRVVLRIDQIKQICATFS